MDLVIKLLMKLPVVTQRDREFPRARVDIINNRHGSETPFNNGIIRWGISQIVKINT